MSQIFALSASSALIAWACRGAWVAAGQPTVDMSHLPSLTAIVAGGGLLSLDLFVRFEGEQMPPPVLDAFLIPSVFGVEPQLDELRRRLTGVVDFELLPLPGAGARGALLTDMAACGRLLVEEVRARRPAGPVALVGYSFGASMALEVAAQLEEGGRRLCFLGALDGPFEPPRTGPVPGAARAFAGPRGLIKAAAVEAAESMDGLRRLVERAAHPDSAAAAQAEPMRRAMLWHLRNKALTGWSPRPVAAPGLHICSGEYGPDNRARWAVLGPMLRTVDVPAAHERLLQDEALSSVLAALQDAIGRRPLVAA